MGLGKSKPRTGRSGYPGNFPNSSHASNYSEKQGYRSQNRNHGAAATGQQGTKPQQQHQQALQMKQMYQQQRRQQQQQVLTQRNKNPQECFVCGHEGHSGLRCHHRKMTCYICNQAGHLASVCKQTQHHPESIFKPKPKPNPNQPKKAAQRNTKSKPKP